MSPIGIRLDYKAVLALAVVGGAAYLFMKSEVKALGAAVNPLDNNNVINSWFNRAYSKVTGSQDTLGEDIADLFYK